MQFQSQTDDSRAKEKKEEGRKTIMQRRENFQAKVRS
jgi:hypothetical protein